MTDLDESEHAMPTRIFAEKRPGLSSKYLAGGVWAGMSKESDLIAAAEIDYSEMAFTLHDILDPRRRKDDAKWAKRRGLTLATSADRLRAALDRLESQE